MTVLAAVGAMAMACGGNGSSGSDVVQDSFNDGREGDVGGNAGVLTPPELEYKTFNLVLEADSTMAAVGAPVHLKVRTGRGTADGTLTYAWALEGGTAAGEPADECDVTFDKAGTYLVSVEGKDEAGKTARAGVALQVVAEGAHTVGDVDGDGTVAQADLDLLDSALDGAIALAPEEFDRADVDLDGRLRAFDRELVAKAVEAGEKAPSLLWPTQLGLGTKIRLIHPALLDPAAGALIAAGDADIVPVRGLPGYATFVLPPDAAEGPLSLKLVVDGKEVQSFEVNVGPAPEASDPPGKKVVQAMDMLGAALADLPAAYKQYFDEVGVPAEQQAAVLGMLQFAIDSHAAHKAAFVDAFNKMEPEGRAAFEQVARSNGLDEVIAELQALADAQGKADLLGGLTPAQSANILSVLCAAKSISDISSKIAEINETAASYLAWFDWWPLKAVPIVGQVISFLSSISTAIGTITDIIDIASKFVPEPGDLGMDLSTKVLKVGESAAVKVFLTIKVLSKLCEAGAEEFIGWIMDQMNEKLTKRMASCMPLVSNAFASADYERDKMGSIVGLIYDAISAIAGKILDALGIEDLLKSLADAVCGLLQDPRLPLDPALAVPSCGGAGASWTCTEACAGTVAFDAKKDVCGEEKEAKDSLQCQGCGQDTCEGCCDGQSCLPHASQSDAKCGTGGTPCAACPQHHACVQGVCTCASECTTAGEKKCVGNDVWICTEVVANPSCLKFVFSEPCINGATCNNGACEGGCNAQTCEGCCLGDGTCMAGDSKDQCGADGKTCAYCAGAQEECLAGSCVCLPLCDGKECGPDGCDGSCGSCPAGSTCDGDGLCQETCGNGVVDPGEDCEDDVECDDGQVCLQCKCTDLVPCTPQNAAEVCEDGHQCTTDSCVDGACVHFANDGEECNDADETTENDHCVAEICKGDPVGCETSQDCDLDTMVCNDADCVDGECGYTVAPDGTPCEDGLPFTQDDHCVGGTCVGLDQNCTPGMEQFCFPFGAPSCLKANCVDGKCVETSTDGQECDDADVCTPTSTCQSGKCVGTPEPDCGTKKCKCSDDGTTLECTGEGLWFDCADCSGWHSLAVMAGFDPSGEFSDGAQLCQTWDGKTMCATMHCL